MWYLPLVHKLENQHTFKNTLVFLVFWFFGFLFPPHNHHSPITKWSWGGPWAIVVILGLLVWSFNARGWGSGSAQALQGPGFLSGSVRRLHDCTWRFSGDHVVLGIKPGSVSYKTHPSMPILYYLLDPVPPTPTQVLCTLMIASVKGIKCLLI